MSLYLGFDTSNYTTSVAVYDSDTKRVVQNKKLLPVKEGELGLRQSDAVFHHVKQLPELLDGFGDLVLDDIKAVGASSRPRNIEGSYMPCFLVGETVAYSVATFKGVPLHKTSHQIGHVLAALYSCQRLDLIAKREPFIAFHVSGGTTDCLLVEYDYDRVLNATELATSLDIKAGQLIDRVGLMLGLGFPCGIELEKLALCSTASFKVDPKLKNGCCCLSGIENKCRDMLEKGVPKCDIALYTLKYIEAVIFKMTRFALEKCGRMPVVYAGGVMSDKLIRKRLADSFDAFFSEPQFSCDNAAGIAVYAAIKDGCVI